MALTAEQNAAILNTLGVLTDFAGNGMLTSSQRMTAIQAGKRLAAAFLQVDKPKLTVVPMRPTNREV